MVLLGVKDPIMSPGYFPDFQLQTVFMFLWLSKNYK